MANITEVASVVKKHIPDAQITFEWDKGEDMRRFNRANSFKVDTTPAFEDFGFQPRYLLDEMVVDFIEEVRRGRGGTH
jgi:nucleoside-diphosphate-sugar epimerase